MAFNFPFNPTVGSIYRINGESRQWNGNGQIGVAAEKTYSPVAILTNSTQITTTAYTNSALFATVQWENNSGEIRPTTNARGVVTATDGGASLGTASLRWANVYTQDMHFSNGGSQGNRVDGMAGNWTLQKCGDEIYMINNKAGKTHGIVMKEGL